ncbi:MAG: hypothetical protein QXQ71_05760 [Desulfurococcaceae archaeon]
MEIEDYLNRVKSIVAALERVSREGMDTSRVEYYLNNALGLLSKGNLTPLEEEWVRGNLSFAEEELSSLLTNLDSYVFWRNIKLGLTIGFIASIPLLTYFFLPRTWAYIWFKTRRKWVVKKNRS